MRALSLLFVASSMACAGGISGEIEGDTVPPFTTSAVADYEVGSDDFALGIWATGGDACNHSAGLYKIRNDADSPEELAEDTEKFAKENMPEEYWYAALTVGGDDFSDLEEEEDLKFDDPDLRLAATLLVCHVKGWPEEKNGLLDTDEECWVATDGKVYIRHDKEGGMSVSTDGDDLIELRETDGDEDFDDLSFGGSAGYCPPLADELEDAFG